MSTTNVILKTSHPRSTSVSNLIENQTQLKSSCIETTTPFKTPSFSKNARIKWDSGLIQTKFGQWPSIAFGNVYAEKILKANR